MAPCGVARAVVAERQSETQVFGLVTIMPPGRLMDAYSDQGRRVVRALADSVAQNDALAVDPDGHGRGVGTSLLAEAERWLTARGVRLSTLKVRQGDLKVMRWYRRRGYLFPLQR